MNPSLFTRRGLRVLLAASLAAFATGCAAPRAPPILLALPPAVALESTPAVPLQPNAPSVALRRVLLPEYLLARRVRFRADPSTLSDWPNTFWAERIEVATTREFSAALRAGLPGWWVCETDCADRAPPRVLEVEFVTFDYNRPQRRLEGRVRWQISALAASSATTPRLVREQAFELLLDEDTPQAQAQAITAVLRDLAQTIAAALVADRGG